MKLIHFLYLQALGNTAKLQCTLNVWPSCTVMGKCSFIVQTTLKFDDAVSLGIEHFSLYHLPLKKQLR